MAEVPAGIERLYGDDESLNGIEDGEEREDEGNNKGDNEEKRDEKSQHGKLISVLMYVLRTGIGLILFLVVLSCITFSKLTLLRLADRLRTLTVVKNVSLDSEEVSIL